MRLKRIFKNLPKELMECARCHWALPLSEFYKTKRYKSGYKTTCIKCCNEARRLYYPNKAKKMADIQKALRKKDRRKTRNYQLKGLYGITMDDYDKMYKKQNGCCEICSKRFEKLFIDHSHVTNKVRGLLCGACNKMIGFAKENTVTLVNAIQYINKHSGVGVQNITTSKAG